MECMLLGQYKISLLAIIIIGKRFFIYLFKCHQTAWFCHSHAKVILEPVYRGLATIPCLGFPVEKGRVTEYMRRGCGLDACTVTGLILAEGSEGVWDDWNLGLRRRRPLLQLAWLTRAACILTRGCVRCRQISLAGFSVVAMTKTVPTRSVDGSVY